MKTPDNNFFNDLNRRLMAELDKPLYTSGPKPGVEEMKKTILKIEELLSIKAINRNKNFAVKEGLTDCLRILNERIENPKNDWFLADKEEDFPKANEIYREQLKGIDKLKTKQGRAIAIMCIDWLNGIRDVDGILKVPIKMR